MPPPELGLKEPVVIAEEGKRGDGYRALIVSSAEMSRTSMHESIASQVWDEDDGYTEVDPVWKFLKFGRWQLFSTPRPWIEPELANQGE